MSKLKIIPRDFAEQWIEALYSGEYKQGSLLKYDKKDNEYYCCLGVACKVYNKNIDPDVMDGVSFPNDVTVKSYVGKFLSSPDNTKLYIILADLNDGDPLNDVEYNMLKRIIPTEDKKLSKKLNNHRSSNNIERWTFEEIAQLIKYLIKDENTELEVNSES